MIISIRFRFFVLSKPLYICKRDTRIMEKESKAAANFLEF